MKKIPLKKTPLYDAHVRLNGKIVDFGGWNLPVQYSGITDEHNAARNAAGIFDVSHMGELEVEGPQAEEFLNYLVTNNVAKLVNGRALYAAMCRENGKIVDDLIIYRLKERSYLIVVNAANIEKDFAWAESIARNYDVSLRNASDQYGQIAIQGPKALKILQKLCTDSLEDIGVFFAKRLSVAGIEALVARTGYTGEDGFEIYCQSKDAMQIWDSAIDEGAPHGLKPCGLGARDTLRLEAALMLYGNDIDESTHPLEAGLGWVVKWKKGDFSGRDFLVEAKENGLKRTLRGLKVDGKMIPRIGYEVLDSSEIVCGKVTSGTLSPTLGYPIALAYLPAEIQDGEKVLVKIRNKTIAAEIVPTPFYRRKK